MKKLSMVTALCLVALTSFKCLPASAETKTWTVKVGIEELQRQFSYKGSSMKGVAKAEVKVVSPTEGGEPKKYESVWFHDGKPIGLERQGQYGVRPTDMVHVEVTQKNVGSEQEYKAAAYQLMRLALVACHNSNSILAMTVPEESFDNICEELGTYNVVEVKSRADHGIGRAVKFRIETESGKEKMLYFKLSQDK